MATTRINAKRKPVHNNSTTAIKHVLFRTYLKYLQVTSFGNM